MHPFMRAPVQRSPISMVLKMSLAIFPIPICIDNRHIGIEQIPTMRPESNRERYFLSKKIEIRIVGNLANYRGWSEQKAGAAKSAADRRLGSVLHRYPLPLHREHSITVEFLCTHRIDEAGVEFVRRRIGRWITAQDGFGRTGLAQHVDE